MGSELTTTEQKLTVAQQWLSHPDFRNALTEASPRDYNAIALARATLTMMKNDKKLLECNTQSLLNAVLICAQTGLLPGPIGMCAIIPYGNSAQWQLMFKGGIVLASRSGAFGSISCEVVYEGDIFDFEEGSVPYVRFQRNLIQSKRGEAIAAYCCIKPKGGGDPSIRIMGIEEIDAIKAKAASNRGPWLTHEDEMRCKTVLKRTLKRLPMSTELALAVGLDDLAESGLEQPVDAPKAADLPDIPEDGFCNKDLEEGLVCSKELGHTGDCKG